MTQWTLHMRVDASDRTLGSLVAVVVDPTTDEVTHLVVRPDDLAGSDRLVPLGSVRHTGESVLLGITRRDVFRLHPFESHLMLPNADEEYGAGGLPLFRLPYLLPTAPRYAYASHERLPKAQLALRRGTAVVDADGHRVGRLHALVVDDESRHVTHLVVAGSGRRGGVHVEVPVTAVAEITEGRIRIDQDRATLGTLGHSVSIDAPG